MNLDNDGSRVLLSSLLQRLSPEDRKKLDSVLSDQAACENLLKSPEAQKLMRELGKKPNG